MFFFKIITTELDMTVRLEQRTKIVCSLSSINIWAQW